MDGTRPTCRLLFGLRRAVKLRKQVIRLRGRRHGRRRRLGRILLRGIGLLRRLGGLGRAVQRLKVLLHRGAL